MSRIRLVEKLSLVVLLVLLVSLLSGCFDSDGQGDAPDFTLTTIDGETFTLSEQLGKVIIIDFMATWCIPCMTEMEELSDVKDEIGADVTIISIAPFYESNQEVQSTFEEYVDKWIFAIDNVDENVAEKYNVQVIPTLYIIDTKGDISYTSGMSGVTGKEKLLQEIEDARK